MKLFEFRLAFPSLSMYDVSRDGRRFLVNVVRHFDHELLAALEHNE